MKVVKDSWSSEAVLEWLKAELNSSRFCTDLRAAINKAGCSEEIIVAADLNNTRENETRWHILRDYRKWLDRNFDDYDWQLVELNREEVGSLQYIDYSYWNELSDGTRKVERAATNVAGGKIVFDVPNDRFFSVAKVVEAGTPLPPIIVVSDHNGNSSEILEGHLRATGYLLAKQSQQPLKAMWGWLHD